MAKWKLISGERASSLIDDRECGLGDEALVKHIAVLLLHFSSDIYLLLIHKSRHGPC